LRSGARTLNMKLKHWDRRQIQVFVREVKDDVGHDAWNILVDRIRRALIAEKVLKIAFLQRDWAPRDVVIELREAMLIQADLEPGSI
jgi:hypothetical protein